MDRQAAKRPRNLLIYLILQMFPLMLVHVLYYTILMPWPSTIPHDLRVLLQALGQHRDPATDADRWGAIKEWLESHAVPAPKGLPTAPEIKRKD